MKAFLMFVLALCAGVNHGVRAQRKFVRLDKIQGEYKNLAEVKPLLVNAGRQSIYLWPQECGEALVSWLGHEYWYDSDLKPCPGVVKPFEIRPGHSYRLPSLVIRSEPPEGTFLEERIGKPGKFRITISYSFKPVHRKGPPQLKESLSKEFSIVP